MSLVDLDLTAIVLNLAGELIDLEQGAKVGAEKYLTDCCTEFINIYIA